VPLGRINGHEVAICYECVEPLQKRLEDFMLALSGAKPRGRRAKRKPKITLEKFRELVIKAVEERGQAQLFEYCRRYGLSRKDARALADQLSKENGWVIEEKKNKLFLKKVAEQSAHQPPQPQRQA